MTPANILQVTPMLHVPDFAEAFRFFTHMLGFKALFQMEGYAYLEREGAGIRLLEEDTKAKVAPPDARMTVYFDVKDVDALYDELKPELDTLSPDDVVVPTDKPWSQRELMVRLPDGHWMAFGQPVKV